MKRIIRLWTKIKQFRHVLLQGTSDHFKCYFSSNATSISQEFLRMFFSRITLSETQLRALDDLPENAVIVHAVKNKSYFEYLFLHSRYSKLGRYCPEIGFDTHIILLQPVSHIFRIAAANLDSLIRRFTLPDPYRDGYIRRMLFSGKTGFTALVDKKGFYQRFVRSKVDPLQHLIEIQKETERPIYIVPHFFFFSIRPPRSSPNLFDLVFGTSENPNRFRRIFGTLFKPGGKVFAEISEPFSIKSFLADPRNFGRDSASLSRMLRNRLISDINRHRQAVTGPLIKSREELKQSILNGERLRDFMAQHAQTKGFSLQKVHRKAAAYIDEIGARYNLDIIKIYSIILTRIIRLMFDGVSLDTDGLQKVKTMSKKGSVIFIPCHKSHIDYLILSYFLFQNNMPCPLIAAGRNLSFWPLGPMFRAGGAFFIRRTFRGAVLYARVFKEYVHKILEEGFNIEFFIEGGRSRTGKLLQPKLGFLSILLEAYKNGACEDLIFAPIYIGYDRVLEENAYLHELAGGQKKPEDLSQVIKARKFLTKRYGRTYINFSEPFSLREILLQNGKTLEEMTQKEYNTLCRTLGQRVLNAIDRMTVVTPHAVMASAILNCSKKRFTKNHLKAYAETYLNYLLLQQAELADTLQMDTAHSLDYVIDTYVGRKLLDRIPAPSGNNAEPQYVVNESKRTLLDYYKNTCISYFIPAAFTALSILKQDAFQFSASDLHSGYRTLCDLFRNEFAYDIEHPPEYHIRKNVKMFIDDAILIPHPTLPDTYNITSAGFRKLRLFAMFLKTYFESYWIVLNYLKHSEDGNTEIKDRLRKIQLHAHRMLKRNEIDHPESLHRIHAKNALDYFTARGIKGVEMSEDIHRYETEFKRYMSSLET